MRQNLLDAVNVENHRLPFVAMPGMLPAALSRILDTPEAY
jgi:hypothetical protein